MICAITKESMVGASRDRDVESKSKNASERLMHEPRDLEHDSLMDWQPVQLP